MSQTSFLEDIESWDSQTCKDKMSQVLPRLIAMYNNGCSTRKKVAILTAMVKSFVPLLDLSVAEDHFFSSVLPSTSKLFEDAVNIITKEIAKEETSNKECYTEVEGHLQIMIDLLNQLEVCIHHVINSCGGSISLMQIASIPTNMLLIIKCAFNHCKDSNGIYGNVFASVSDLLANLFKRAYALQKALMTLLEAAEVDGRDCTDLTVEVCQGFHALCNIISSMDTMLMAASWKFLIKFLSRHKSEVEDDIEIFPLVKSLTSEIRSHFTYCLMQAPLQPGADVPSSQGRNKKMYSKTLKICSLCAKMLLHLFDRAAEESCECLLELMIHLLSYSPPSTEAPPMTMEASEELYRSLLGFTEPLLQSLVPCRNFAEHLLYPSQDHPSDQQFGKLLTLLNTIKILPLQDAEVHDRYHMAGISSEDPPQEPIINHVLSAVSKCYAEYTLPIYLPGIMSDGKPYRSVSLHEYIVTHICGYVATLSSNHFAVVEKCLLQAVLSQDTNSALVAMDIWCFIARFGTADLCANHCGSLAKLLKSLPANHNPQYLHLCLLLRRLIPLMAAESQEHFVSDHPFEENPRLWHHIPLTALSGDLRTRLCQQAYRSCTENMRSLLGGTEKLTSVRDVVQSLHMLCNISECFEGSEVPVNNQLSISLCEAVLHLYKRLPLDKTDLSPLTSSLLECTGCLLNKFSADQLFQILQRINDLMKSDPLLEVRHGCISVLRRLSSINVTNSSREQEVLHLLPDLFATLLIDQSMVIQQLAMEAFSTFAEETVHESVVPECLKDEETQGRVVDFLNQTPLKWQSTKTEAEMLKDQGNIICRERMTADHDSNDAENDRNDAEVIERLTADHDSNDAENDRNDAEPQPKKLKSDSKQSFQKIFQGLRFNVQQLQKLSEEQSKPPWLNKELTSIISLIERLKSDTI